jgi:uncharacterized membrane protein YecN with MAPEG domain
MTDGFFTDSIHLAALITVLAAFLYEVLSFNVGRARGKYDVPLPQTVGPEGFNRVYRVQMNTLEQLAFFLPSLWLCAIYMPKPWLVGGLGGAWLVARLWFAIGYYRDIKKRVPGFLIALLSANALLVAALIGIIDKFL